MWCFKGVWRYEEESGCRRGLCFASGGDEERYDLKRQTGCSAVEARVGHLGEGRRTGGGVRVEMVTLMMRSPELPVAEKLSMANVAHEQEKAGSQKASTEVRSRSRKGRNAQKKQPQRGLGVAQLEKLRLQEQSKLEAACFASLQGLPPAFGFADQSIGGICFQPMKSIAMSHHPSALSFCNDRAENVSHYLGGDSRQFGKDGDMFRTIISLANSDHSTAGSFARHGQEGVALMLPRSRESMEQSYGTTSMRTGPSLASWPGSKGQGSCGTYAEESSCGKQLRMACRGSPPSPTAKSLFPNALSAGGHLVDSLASNVEQVEQQRLSEAEKDSVHKFQVCSNGVGDAAGVGDTKLLPAAGKYGAGLLFTSNGIQCFESSSGPAKLRRLSQDRTDLPSVVGLAKNFGRPKELSSFQSFSSNNTWLATEKICGQKRPWNDLKVNTSKCMHSESLDLNATAAEVEVAHDAGVAHGLESPVGVHDAPGISRSGLGYALPLLKDKGCASWQETEVQNLSTTTDVGFHSGDSFLKVSCPPQSRIRDCCSSVCSPCGSPVTRRRCLSSPECHAPVAVEHETSGDFLTLGISSRSYPTSPQYEVNSKESTSPDMVHQAKRVINSEAEVDNSLHLQMSNRHQESAPSVTGGVYSPSCTDNSFFSAVGLSCRFTSTSSSNVTEDYPKQIGSEERREFLDLRLKLTL